MAAFHVFVEGAIDGSQAGVERLAAAIAAHYGLPAGELQMRLAKGRFRVKGNCDRATADSYVRDLTQLGALCTVEDAAAPSRASTPAIATPPRGTPTTRTTTPPTSALKSGLAAAFGGDRAEASLGALDNNSMLTLAAVDGGSEPEPAAPAASFAPPAAEAPRPKPATVKAAPPSSPAAAASVDMFAPPDAAEEAAFKVELADDEVERSAKKRASIPPATAPAEAPEPAPRVARVSIQPTTVAPAARGMANPKTRFALGVVIAIVVGFVPAHLLASVREKSAYAEIDRAVDQTQREADTQDAYDALDVFRERQLVRKYDARHSAAILAFLVWGVLGGGIAYVWFRRIRWPDA
jgi:hypothetical protein